MIPRYNRPKIEKIWTLENKFKIWIEIEILIAEKLADIGTIPKIAAKEIRKKGGSPPPHHEHRAFAFACPPHRRCVLLFGLGPSSQEGPGPAHMGPYWIYIGCIWDDMGPY